MDLDLKFLVQTKNNEIAQFLSSKTKFNNSLYEGLGALLYLYDYSELYDNSTIRAVARKRIHEITGGLTFEKPQKPEVVLSGPIGVVALLKILKKFYRYDISNYNRLVNEVDKVAYHLGSVLINEKVYDFLYGAIGIAHYFSLTLTDTSIRFFEKIVQSLLNDAKKESGIYWSDALTKKAQGVDCVNLGIPHGIIGILRLLISLYNKNINRKLVYATLKEIVKFIKGISSYPNLEQNIAPCIIEIGTQNRHYTNRLGWCYGNLVLGYVLYQCAEILQDANLSTWSTLIIRNTLSTKLLKDADISDPYLCHGSSFLIYMYTKMQSIDEASFLAQSAHWAKITIEMQVSNKSYCNYENAFFESDQKKIGVLSGIAGIGFAFNTFLKKSTHWDILLMLNDL